MSWADWKVGGGIVWRFDGDSGCDKCSEWTGLYDNKPDLPHPNCSCPPITQEVIVGVYTTVLKNKSVSDSDSYEIEHEGVREWVNNSSTPETHTLTFSETFEVSVGLSQKVEDEFTAAGSLKGTLTVTDSITKVVEPGTGVSVDVIAIVEVKEFEADQYYVFKDGTEVFDSHLSEQGQSLEGSRVETNDI